MITRISPSLNIISELSPLVCALKYKSFQRKRQSNFLLSTRFVQYEKVRNKEKFSIKQKAVEIFYFKVQRSDTQRDIVGNKRHVSSRSLLCEFYTQRAYQVLHEIMKIEYIHFDKE